MHLCRTSDYRRPAPTATLEGVNTALLPHTNPVRLLPGMLLSLAAVAASLAVSHRVPQLSALLLAIVLGMLLRNTTGVPSAFEAGLTFTAKRFLRAGVVLLGLQLSLADIVQLGWGVLGVVVVIVAGGISTTVLLGRKLGMTPSQTLLIAAGFSICGAAAVAAMDGVIEAEDNEEVVTAITLVVLFGTLMIPVLPLLAGALGLTDMQTGMWAGVSVHEVAQVVAIGGSLGATALATAVIVKLARVLMLAPTMAVISWRRRAVAGVAGKRPPLMPLFVALFVVAVILSPLLPPTWAAPAHTLQTALLGAAMFALGTSVKFSSFRQVGVRPFILAGAATVTVAALGYAGVTLAS